MHGMMILAAIEWWWGPSLERLRWDGPRDPGGLGLRGPNTSRSRSRGRGMPTNYADDSSVSQRSWYQTLSKFPLRLVDPEAVG
jgi:hypothetical protein